MRTRQKKKKREVAKNVSWVKKFDNKYIDYKNSAKVEKMDIYSEIAQKLKAIVGVQHAVLFPAKVKAVQENVRTCTVEIDTLQLTDVRLCAVVDDNLKQLFVKPKTESMVLVADLSNGEFRDLVVVKFSETEKIEFHGGELGGLIKIEELTNKLNAIEQDINTLKSLFSGWVIVPSDGGAALKTAVTTWAGQTLTITKTDDYEDKNITH